MRPKTGDYPEYFGLYINQVQEENLDQAFANQKESSNKFLESIPAEKWDYAYAEGKWTIKELLQHIIDAERVFNYRALCFARKETISLPSFDEDTYAANSDANRRAAKDLIAEFVATRTSTELLFKSFSEEMLQNIGVANNKQISVLSLGFITVGHYTHHQKVIRERYLS